MAKSIAIVVDACQILKSVAGLDVEQAPVLAFGFRDRLQRLVGGWVQAWQ